MSEIRSNTSSKYSKNDFDSIEFIIKLMKFKWLIIVLTMIGTITVSVYIFMEPNWYKSTANILPPKSSGSAFEGLMNNISSTLKNIGITKLGSKTDSYYTQMVFLQNRSIFDIMIKKYNLTKEYDMVGEKYEDILSEFQNNLEITSEMDGNYTVSITSKDPVKAAVMTNDYIGIANNLSMEIFQKESKYNIEYLAGRLRSTDSLLNILGNSIRVFSEKYQIYMPEEQAKSISTALIELKSELFQQEMFLEMLKKKYGEGDQYTIMQKSIIDNLKIKISQAENEPGFAGNFSIKNAGQLGVEYIKLYAEFETFTKVKAFLTPMLEEQRINQNRETMSFIFLDRAIPAQKKDKPKRSVYVLGAFFGSFTLSIILVTLISGFIDFKRKYNLITDNINKNTFSDE